jgi:hypothetical protein
MMKNIYGLSMLVAATVAAFVCAQPAHAGSWQVTGSGTGNVTSGSWGSGFSSSNSGFTDYAFDQGTGGESGTFTWTGSVQWVGGGTQPSSVTLDESADMYCDALYTATATQTAVDGLGDASTTVTNYNPYANVVTTSTGSHQTVVPMSQGEVYHFTRDSSASSIGGQLNDCSAQYSVSAS